MSKWEYALVASVLSVMALPVQAEDARTLPKGRSRLGFIYAKSNGITQQYNEQGVAEDLTKPYNVHLDSEAIQSFTAKMGPEFANLVALLNDTGLRYDASKSGTESGGVTSTDASKPLLGEALSKGFLGVDVEAVQSQNAITYMHGVTDRLSVGFMIPVITNKVRASAGLSKINNTVADYQKAFGSMGSGFEPIVSGLGDLDAATIETLQQQALEANGYKRFGSSEQTGIGDINFGGRFNYLKTPKETWFSSGQLLVSAPTGKTRATNALTEVDFGSGTWDLASAHIINYIPGGVRSPWTFSNGSHFTYRLPGRKIMRVREDSKDILPGSSSEEDVRTNFGTKFWTNLAASYSLNNVVTFSSSYEWYWKSHDHYSGDRQKDYGYLSEKTDSYSETINLAMSISMIDGFTNKQFPLPMDFSLNFYKPTKGRNALIASFFTFEAAMYF